MNDLNTVNDVQVPVVEAPSEQPCCDSGSEEQMADVTLRPQTRQENASFRKMRLENERLRLENDTLTQREIERRMQEDLAAIRELDPTVGSLEELGEQFGKMISLGVDAPVAFAAIRQSHRAKMPPSLGALESQSGREKQFYSPEEVDRLSPAELGDPDVWERVRASMTRWK